MLLCPTLHVGTEGYPDKVARRLRSVNLAAWVSTLVAGGFAVYLALHDWDRFKPLVGVNALGALMWGIVPLFHRFGPMAAPVYFGLSVYASNIAVTAYLGTDSGVPLYYMAAAALVVVFFGFERLWFAVFAVALGAALHIACQFMLPARSTLIDVEPFLVHSTYAISVIAVFGLLFALVYYGLRQTARAEAIAEREFERSERLLANILPPPVAERLKRGDEEVIADSVDSASILFVDLAGFTSRASDVEPSELVVFLNGIFSRFDTLVAKYKLEKIKTIGDAYMVASGVPEPRDDHADAVADLALDMVEAMSARNQPGGEPVKIRIGISSGPVVAGVVGTRKFAYDVWGDTVNVAARMESQGEIGRIQISDFTRSRLSGRFQCEDRGVIDVRGRGPLRTWFLVGRTGE